MINQPTSASSTSLKKEAVEVFRSNLRGMLLQPGDEGYEQARKVWNGMIDRRPALIVRCAGVADVIQAVNFAKKQQMLVSVKGGGHNVAGSAVCDKGLMIDLSLMKGIRVDPENKKAHAGAGVLWQELDHETQAFGLATTGGTVSHTGIAGLTLGGGLGWLMGMHGLACDNLLSADIVTADGKLLTLSEHNYQDLFWAVRGGGGNFGIVTSFEYRLHPVGPMVLGGLLLYPMSQAREVLTFYRDYVRNMPDALAIFVSLLTTPDHMPLIALIIGWFGPVMEGERYLKPLREFATPLADLLKPLPYTQFQCLLDGGAPHGMYRYWKSGFVKNIEDEFIEVILRHAERKTSPHSVILFFHIKGAAARVPADRTAVSIRDDQWDFDIVAQWENSSETDIHLAWAKSFWEDVKHSTRGVYSNHLDRDDGSNRVRLAYGANYERLVAIKRKYDPDNFFRLNNNIVP